MNNAEHPTEPTDIKKDNDLNQEPDEKKDSDKPRRPKLHIAIWLSVALLVILVLTTVALLAITLKDYPQGDRNVVALFPNQGSENVYMIEKVPAEFAPYVTIGSATANGDSPIYESGNTIDLFKNKYLNADGDITVESANGDKVIAPGTENSYDFKLKNTGNISLDYTLKIDCQFAYDGAKLPVQIRLRCGNEWIVGDENTWVYWENMVDLFDKTRTVESGDYILYTIDWRWPYEADPELLEDMNVALWEADKNDTILGNAATETNTRFDVNIRTVAVVTEGAHAVDSWGNKLYENVLRPLGITYVGWLVLIIILVAIALEILFVYFFLFRKKEKPEPTPVVVVPAPAPEPEPAPAPVPVPVPAPAPEPEPYEFSYAATGNQTYINLDTLSENFKDGDTVTMETLKAKGLIHSFSERVKILARGELTVHLIIYADDFSEEAYEKIIAAGSSAISITRKPKKKQK